MIELKQFDIVIEAGADFSIPIIIRDSENALVDLTGATVLSQVREYPEAAEYSQFTATHNGSGGKIFLVMPHEGTADLGYSSGYYDVFITFPDSEVMKVVWGNVTVIPNVTKPLDGSLMYQLSFASEDEFPIQGMTQRIYFSHASNKMWRWNGTNYVSIVTDGEAATVEVGTVTTGEPGSYAEVVNRGDEHIAVFDFTIPRGDKGEKGDVMFATFEIFPGTGMLVMTTEDAYNGPDFRIQEGYLEVII